MRAAFLLMRTMTPISPLVRYQLALAATDFSADPIQATAIAKLDAIYSHLVTAPPQPQLWARLIRRPTPTVAIKGLYMWGGVGRGKTFVVDTFFACLPEKVGRRVHFHSFMQDIHRALKKLRGTSDPLHEIARRWAKEFRVLCLDEFHVVDITDAMLLAQLLTTLFDAGVILVTTSNEAPDRLYQGGLQRERFLPAIALLKTHLDIYEFSGSTDYRLRTLTQAATYYVPNNDAAELALAARYAALTHRAAGAPCALIVEGRTVMTRAHDDGVVWFDFVELCGGPRATTDYIEIGCCFHTVLISNIPCFGDDDSDPARRFINLIDEFYDRGVNVLCSAAARPDALYRGARLPAAFARTASRVVEMQSEQYLSKPHLSA